MPAHLRLACRLAAHSASLQPLKVLKYAPTALSEIHAAIQPWPLLPVALILTLRLHRPCVSPVQQDMNVTLIEAHQLPVLRDSILWPNKESAKSAL